MSVEPGGMENGDIDAGVVHVHVTCASGKWCNTACCMVNLYKSVSRSDGSRTGILDMVRRRGV